MGFGLAEISSGLSQGRPLRVSSLLSLGQGAEARSDPLVGGMIASLMKQVRRAVANRDAADDDGSEARLDPDQVVAKGEEREKKEEEEELEEGETMEDDDEEEAATERPILTAGISSALARLFDHYRLDVPRHLTLD